MKVVRLRALSSCLQTAILIRFDSRPSGIAGANHHGKRVILSLPGNVMTEGFFGVDGASRGV